MRTLTTTDTNVLKGIALLLLLCHHCFYRGEPYDDILIFGHLLFHNISRFSGLCVAIFVFLSGYGLTAKSMKDNGIGDLCNFYRYRYMKLMLNFWVIYLLFVPVGILFFHRTFSMVYGDYYIFKAIVDFLGIHYIVVGHPYGYNATWWFFSCIILLYFIYPLLWRFRILLVAMIPCSIMIPFFLYWSDSLRICATYLLPFCCGMVMAMHGRNEKIGVGGKLCLSLFFLLGCIYMFYSSSFAWQTGLIVIGIALYSSVDIPCKLKVLLAFWGKHSYNIFMFHTFIYYYYLSDYIHWSKNPVAIFLTLLFVCTLLSWIIELLKNKLNFNKVVVFVAK